MTTELYTSGAQPSALPAPANAGEGQHWFDTKYGEERLKIEERAMDERFPGFVLVWNHHGDIAWVGTLESSLPRGKRYRLVVAYPHRFPDEAPGVWILDPEIPNNTPHLLSERRPCLYRPHNDSRYGYSASTTAATMVAWTALWIHAYETWQATRVWPGRED